MRWPSPDEFEIGSPVILFDGRSVEIVAEPERTEPIGLWALVREVLNAEDPAFSYPKYGPEETVALAGAVNAISKGARRPANPKEVPS